MTTILNLRDSKRQEPARDKRLLIYSGSPLPPRPLPFPPAAKTDVPVRIGAGRLAWIGLPVATGHHGTARITGNPMQS